MLSKRQALELAIGVFSIRSRKNSVRQLLGGAHGLCFFFRHLFYHGYIDYAVLQELETAIDLVTVEQGRAYLGPKNVNGDRLRVQFCRRQLRLAHITL